MKGPDANDTSWVSVIFTIACLAMSEILENSLYNKILTAVMILILIFIVIRRLKVTLYDIQTQDDKDGQPDDKVIAYAAEEAIAQLR